jgi:hypothetical protein
MEFTLLFVTIISPGLALIKHESGTRLDKLRVTIAEGILTTIDFIAEIRAVHHAITERSPAPEAKARGTLYTDTVYNKI